MGADFVLLPELITSGYMLESAEEAAPVAIRPDHLFEDWCGEARSEVDNDLGGFWSGLTRLL